MRKFYGIYRKTQERFHLRKLQHDIKLQEQILNNSKKPLKDLLQFVITRTRTLSPSQELVNETYIRIITQLWKIAEDSVGTYSVTASRKSTPNKKPKHRTDSITNAFSQFRIHHRLQNPLPTLVSADPSRTAWEDAVHTYRELFTANPNLDNSKPTIPTSELAPRSLVNTFTPSFIRSFFSKYPKTKVSGPDALHTLLFHALSDSQLPVILTQFIQWILKFGVFPDGLNYFELVLLGKPAMSGKKTATPSEFRTLGLSSMIRRLIERGIISWLKAEGQQWMDFDPTQGGFRHGFSTYTSIAWLHETQTTDKGLKTLLIDLTKAYDRVHIPFLLNDLHERNAPPGFIKLIDIMFSRNWTHVRIGSDISETFARTRGLPQGSLLSPILFNVYIDSLASRLRSNLPPLPPHNLPAAGLYADDVAIRAYDDETLVRGWNIVVEWAKARDMIINTRKSVIVSQQETNIQLGADMVTSRQKDKYLGMEFDYNGILPFENHWKRYAISNRALGTLKHIGHSWTPRCRSIMYKTFIRSRMEYGLPFLTYFGTLDQPAWKSLCKKMGSAQAHVLKWISAPMGNEVTTHPNWMNNLATQRNIIGLQSWLERCLFIISSFGNRLRTNVHPSNPIANLMHRSGTFLYSATHQPMLLRYDSMVSEELKDPESKPPTFKQWCVQDLVERNTPRDLRIHYTSSYLRVGSSLCHPAFTAPMGILLNFVMHWILQEKRNWVVFESLPQCNGATQYGDHRLDRFCLVLCFDFWTNLLDIGITKQRWIDALGRHQKDFVNESYCVIDDLIHARNWEAIDIILNHILGTPRQLTPKQQAPELARLLLDLPTTTNTSQQ